MFRNSGFFLRFRPESFFNEHADSVLCHGQTSRVIEIAGEITGYELLVTSSGAGSRFWMGVFSIDSLTDRLYVRTFHRSTSMTSNDDRLHMCLAVDVIARELNVIIVRTTMGSFAPPLLIAFCPWRNSSSRIRFSISRLRVSAEGNAFRCRSRCSDT